MASLYHMMFEHLAEGRECGTCVACCELLGIDDPDLKKPANLLCPNCTGTQCGIYETRPQTCRKFYCLWRRLPLMPETMKPENSGIVVQVVTTKAPRHIFEKVYIQASVKSMEVLNTEIGKSVMNLLVEQGVLPVWVSYGADRKLFYPVGDFQDAILSPTTTAHKHLVQAALRWRQANGLNPTETTYPA